MKKNEIFQSLKIIILGLVLSFGLSLVSADLTPPAGTPLGENNVAGPINTGPNHQGKGGNPEADVLLHVEGTLSSKNLAVFGDVSVGQNVKVGNLSGGGDKWVCADSNEGKLKVCDNP